MTNVVHLQTQIVTMFGLVDEDNNAVPQQPATVTVNFFSKEAFAEAFERIVELRDQATADLSESDA